MQCLRQTLHTGTVSLGVCCPVALGSMKVDRAQLLAAEIFGYSFANYADHLGIGNVRYERLMPEDAETLETAEREGWSASKIAAALEVDMERAEELLEAFQRAREVVDAENPAEAFRNGVRFSIVSPEEGLRDAASVEKLVTQICYRAADLAFLLARAGKTLSQYSRHLRREPGVEYYEGYFGRISALVAEIALCPRMERAAGPERGLGWVELPGSRMDIAYALRVLAQRAGDGHIHSVDGTGAPAENVVAGSDVPGEPGFRAACSGMGLPLAACRYVSARAAHV